MANKTIKYKAGKIYHAYQVRIEIENDKTVSKRIPNLLMKLNCSLQRIPPSKKKNNINIEYDTMSNCNRIISRRKETPAILFQLSILIRFVSYL